MTPDYLRELADKVDTDKLWQIPGLDQMSLPPEQRWRLDAGVALRRHAAHLEDLQKALERRESLLLVPLSPSSSYRATVPTPDQWKEHQGRWQASVQQAACDITKVQ